MYKVHNSWINVFEDVSIIVFILFNDLKFNFVAYYSFGSTLFKNINSNIAGYTQYRVKSRKKLAKEGNCQRIHPSRLLILGVFLRYFSDGELSSRYSQKPASIKAKPKSALSDNPRDKFKHRKDLSHLIEFVSHHIVHISQ